ncbi:MAG: DCC1-like thiol-disulfide oxidoreductase family protein [Vicinamibacteria bacterium]
MLDNVRAVAHLVLYDGVCGLCDHFVQFLIRIDQHDRLRFAALQGALGAKILNAHGRSATALSTVVAIPDYDPAAEPSSLQLLDRSDAALFAIASVGGVYGGVGALRIFPRFLRNAVYVLVARSRYRVFGRFDACPVPTAATRARFLDLPVRTPLA